MSKNKSKTLSWDAFQSLGNPDNPELENDDISEEVESEDYRHLMEVRIWLDKKNRGGKTASVIKGIDFENDQLKALGKELKSKCGVGGAVKNGEIIIQGDQRQKLLKALLEKGFKKTKLAGG